MVLLAVTGTFVRTKFQKLVKGGLEAKGKLLGEIVIHVLQALLFMISYGAKSKDISFLEIFHRNDLVTTF